MYVYIYNIITLCYNKMLRGSPVSSVVPCSNGHPMVIRIVKRQAPELRSRWISPIQHSWRSDPWGCYGLCFGHPNIPTSQCVIIIFPIGMFQVAIFGVFLWGIHHFFGGRFQHDIADADGFMGIIAGVLHLHDRIWREGAPRNCKP